MTSSRSDGRAASDSSRSSFAGARRPDEATVRLGSAEKTTPLGPGACSTQVLASDAEAGEPAFAEAAVDGRHAAADVLSQASELEAEFFRRSVRGGRNSGRYDLVSVRNAGGMGAILDVFDLDLGRRVAMKVLLPARRDGYDGLSRFVSEARITGFLEHPHIIPVHDLGLAREAGLYYTMKLVQGESLRPVLDRLRAHHPETLARWSIFALLGMFRKVCDAVAYAHSHRVLHLDINPQNILLGRYGEVFLTDWGLATVCGDPADEADPARRTFLADVSVSTRLRSRQIAGTPAFMAPEQARGDTAALDERTDVFLLGATLYHVLALSPPYTAEALAEVLALARRCEVVPPQLRSPERQIPAELGRIVIKAMAREKAARHASVAELAEEVDAVMAARWLPETRRRFAAGELLMSQGEAAEESYVILSGRVSVSAVLDGERVPLRDCGVGEIVGEMALVSHELRSPR